MSINTSGIDNPMQLSVNFVLSCEANNLTGYSVGAELLSWTDNSDLNNHLIPTATNRRPSFYLNAIDHKAVRFDGVTDSLPDQCFTTNSYVQRDSITYIIAIEFVSLPFTSNIIVGRYKNAGNREFLSIGPNGGITMAPTLSSPTFTSPAGTIELSKKYVFAYRRNSSGKIDLWVNMAKVIDGQNTDFTYDTLAVRYGVCASGGGSSADAILYQVHICHEALSDNQIKKLSRYAAFKSGIKI